MISTSSQTFRQLPAAANTFSSGENSIPSPSCVRFRQQSSSFSVIAKSCASVARCVPVSTCPASLYEILGIPMGVTIEEIKAAYRRLARVCDPDVAAIDQKDSFADEFMMLIALYRILISVPIMNGSFLEGAAMVDILAGTGRLISVGSDFCSSGSYCFVSLVLYIL